MYIYRKAKAKQKYRKMAKAGFVKFGVLNVFDCMVVLLNQAIKQQNLDVKYNWKVSFIKHN